MSASLGLFRLQQIDRKMARIYAQQDSIRGALENDRELQSVLGEVEAARGEQFRAASQLKNVEAEVSATRIKIQQSEASLYGGAVKNPKELQELEKEIASLKKHALVLEESELDAMTQAEETEMKQAAAQAKLEILQAKRGSEQKKMLEELAVFSADLEGLNEERGAALASVDAALRQTYENLKEQKKGVAVSEVTEGGCASCGANLTAALQQSARSNKLAYCPSCGRILYAQ